jgi:phage terminase Nu1 subunit (DNA packaging protein)
MRKSKEKFPEMVLSAVQVAALFGVSTRSVRGYAERGLLIRTENGRYPVSGFGRYFDYLRRQADENADTHALTSARASLAARRAEEVKLRLDRLRAEYVDRETVATGWRQVREIVDRHILVSADRILAAIPTMTAHDRVSVEELTRDILQNIDEEAIALGIIGAEK